MMFLILVCVCLFVCLFNAENERLKVLNILPGNPGILLLIYLFGKLLGYDFVIDQASFSVVFKWFRKITLKAN